NVSSGGIIFSTIQKFAPKAGEIVEAISTRSDIYIIADEAHRSQYGLDAKMDADGNSKYGYAKHIRDALPNANYIGFTGTPIDFDDKSTTAVFGDYIDTYDMTRAVEDGATVKIYYENRFVKLDMGFPDLSRIDGEFEEIMEGQEEETVERTKKDITKMEAIIGS
ncbi:DEAD/DEAH box helicase family protein, partial [Cetobacterium sp. ZWU0022]|uniref:DEAD/DEAH box helicase family protein n=1 Tax=Cetobacterium sp. ZWU0022 TaxID=1340502 RepID=UPI000646E8AF